MTESLTKINPGKEFFFFFVKCNLKADQITVLEDWSINWYKQTRDTLH